MNPPTATPADLGHRPAYLLATIALASALAVAILQPGSPASPAVVRADGPTPTPLPTSTLTQLPDVNPGVPRPEPQGIVHVEGSTTNCVQNDMGESGEAAVAGVMVRLKDDGGAIVRQQLSNAAGIVDFYDANGSLAAGSYKLDVVLSGSNWSFYCGQPGTAHGIVYSSPVAIESPGYLPADMLVNIGVQ